MTPKKRADAYRKHLLQSYVSAIVGRSVTGFFISCIGVEELTVPESKHGERPIAH